LPHLEIEVKIRVDHLVASKRALLDMGFSVICGSSFEKNLIFDRQDLSLQHAGILLRLRQYGGTCVLTLKSPASNKSGHGKRYKVREETETVVADLAAMQVILEALGFQLVFVYEKYREELEKDGLRVMLDHTPIGDFMEIEGAEDAIDALARDLGISPSGYISDSYRALFFSGGHRGFMTFGP